MARNHGPIAVPKNIETWLYNALNRLNDATRQSTAGLAAIDRGEAPNGSGNPLIPDLTNYFYKPGLQGGQLAYGALEASGFLKLSSTANTTKGKIYLGTALVTAYDELNQRLGIGTASPSAKLHVKGEAPSTEVRLPNADNIDGTWLNELGSSTDLYASIDEYTATLSDANYIASGGADVVKIGIQGGAAPASGSVVTIYYRGKVSAGTSNILFVLEEGAAQRATNGVASTTGFVTYSYTLTALEIASITNWSNLFFTFRRNAGVVVQISAAWMEITGAGVGAGGYTALFDSDAAQLVDNTQWRNSAGTSLISVTAAGRLTIESGGTMRFVPGAGVDKIIQSNASGDLSLVAVSGDVTQTGGVFTIGANKVTLAQMAQVATARILGRVTAGTGNVEAMTGTQTTTLLDVFTTSLKGLVPTGGSSSTYLRGDATWQALTLAGWTDDGTVVRLTTNTDQVGIGTTSPSASLAIVNVNATSDIVLKVVGKAAQSGSLISVQNSSARDLFSVGTTGSITLGNNTDTGNIIFTFAGTGVTGPSKTVITWGDNASNLGLPTTTADAIGCTGARFYTYKDTTGVYDSAYGQSDLTAWVLISDETVTYDFWTGRHPSAPFLRCSWAGNGDFTNYGLLHSRKSISAGTKGIPSLRLEETGAGTDYISLRAPAAVAANRVQLLLDMNGTIPIVGDDPPAVASKALGKVDSTGLAAAVASTNLTNTATAGLYQVDYSIMLTTADVTAGTMSLGIAFTDTRGATTRAGTAIDLTGATTVRDSGSFLVQLASGELAYSTTLTGIIGTARYALYVRVIYLG